MEGRRLLAIEGSSTTTERKQVEKPPLRTRKWSARVRTGCLTCRARRVKCDEASPSCMRCVKARKQCRYRQAGEATAFSDNEQPPRLSLSQIFDILAFYNPSLNSVYSDLPEAKKVEFIETATLNLHVEALFNLPNSFQLLKKYPPGPSREIPTSIFETFLEKLYAQREAFPKTDQLRLFADQLGQHSFRELISGELYSSFQRSIGTSKGMADDPFEQNDERLDNFEKYTQNTETISIFKALNTPRMDTWKATSTFNSVEQSEDLELSDNEDFDSPNVAAIAKHLLSSDSMSLEEDANSDDHQSESIEDAVSAEPVCEQAHNSHYGGFIAKICHQFQIWLRQDKPPGHRRVTWTSALGKSLYVDVKGLSEMKAKALQARLGGMAALGGPLRCPAQCDMDVAGFMSRQDLECHMRDNHLTRGIETTASSSSIGAIAKPDRTHEHSSSGDYHKMVPSESKLATRLQLSPIIASDGKNKQLCAELRPRFLFLCISTAYSVKYCPIDVTHILSDQLLFQTIRDNYNDVKQSTSWARRFTAMSHKYMPWLARTGFKGIDLFSPRYAELVSFLLLPWAKGDEEFLIPFDLQPSYPPEDEVWAQRWDYRPCPKSFTSFKMNEAFVTTMLEPGHAYRHDAWLHLFPKKLHSELKFQNGMQTVGWGIHIAEGINTYAATFLIAVGSGLVGVLYTAIAKDAGAGFTIAAWIATVAALFVASAQLRA